MSVLYQLWRAPLQIFSCLSIHVWASLPPLPFDPLTSCVSLQKKASKNSTKNIIILNYHTKVGQGKPTEEKECNEKHNTQRLTHFHSQKFHKKH